MGFQLTKWIFCGIALLFVLASCKQEPAKPIKENLVIHLPQDPERLNPVYDSRAVAREVFQYMYLPLADYHPESLQLFPILIKSIPEAKQTEDGNVRFRLDILEEAKWSDGTALTAKDVEFTLKAVMHPESSPQSWKSYLRNIVDIQTSETNPGRIDITVDGNYMLAQEIVSTPYVVPKHVYKNANALDAFSVEQIKSWTEDMHTEESRAFIEDFNDPKYFSSDLVTNGPYELANWETDVSLQLKAVDNYWGDKYTGNPFFKSNIDQLDFVIIKDELTAITAFKEGKIDLVKGISSRNYNDLQEEIPNASYLNSQMMRYFYIALNNNNPILNDVKVREALTHVVNVDQIIEKIESGYGLKINGPFHPAKKYYAEDPTPVSYNPAYSKEVLEGAGWDDSNENGTLDKVVDGSFKELELDLLITGSDLSKNIGLLIQSEAEQIGIKVNIVPKDIRRMRSENLYTYDYDMAALVEGQDHAADDPYRRWHSTNINEKGSNILAYKSDKADSLITLIRQEVNPAQRSENYQKLQLLLHDEYPCIFLYAPTEKFAINENINATVTSKRPGYLANTFTSKS